MSKYKSPLSRSKNTSVTSLNTSQCNDVEPPLIPSENNSLMNNTFNSLFVHDHQSMQASPVRHQWRGRGNSSPRFNGPRPRGSPYQWTPNKHNNSWSSDVIIYTFKIDIMYGNCITYFF